MSKAEWQTANEIAVLRVALMQAEALCETLDKAEFIEPMNFDGDIDAIRAKKAIRARLEYREAEMLRETENRNGRLKSFAI